MNKVFDINADEVVLVTKKLEQINRSAMPVSVRESLNKAAYTMQTRYMPHEFKEDFIIRRPTFLKAHSRYNKSPNTFDLNKMQSEAGIIKGKSVSGDRLELQERGGDISDRWIPYRDGAISYARKSSQYTSKIDADYYFNKYKNHPLGRILRTPKKTLIKSEKQLFEISVGSEWRTLYILKSRARIKPKRFIEPSGELAAKHIPDFYYQELIKRIKKLAS